MSKNTNLILLKDYVSEAFLIERFEGLYNCPTGYGHNPFTDTCYPIPEDFDISGIAGLAPVVRKTIKGKKGVKKKKKIDNNPFIFDEDSFMNLAVDLSYAIENPLEAARNCVDVNPFASLLGFTLGAPSGLTSIARTARGGVVLGKKTIQFGFLAGKAIGVTGLLLGGTAAAVMGHNMLSDLDFDDHKNVGKETAQQLKDKIEDVVKDPGKLNPMNNYNTFCLAFLGAGSFMATRLLRTIGRNAQGRGFFGDRARIAAEMKTSAFKKFMYTNTRTGLSKFFNEYGKVDDLSVLMLLKTKDEAKIPLRFINGKGFQFQGSGKLTIPVSSLNEAQKKWAKKYISGDDVIVDVDKANQIFAKQNSSVTRYIDERFRSQAGNEIKNIPEISGGQFQGNLQRLVKIMGRQGGITPKNILKNYYKTTSDAMAEVIDSSRPQILELYELQIKLNKQKSKLGGISPVKLAKYRAKVAKHGDLADLSLGSDSYYKKLTKSEQQNLLTYLTDYKTVHSKDLELSKKLALAHNVFTEEAKFVKNTTGRKANFNKYFLSSEGAAAGNEITEKLSAIRNYIPTLEEAGLRSITSMYGKFFLYPVLTGGALYTYNKVLPQWREEVLLSIIEKTTNKFVKEKINEDYLKTLRIVPTDDDINLKKLFADFNLFFEQNTSKRPSTEVSKKFIKELCTQAPKSKNVNEYFNKGKYTVNVDRLRLNFKNFILEQSKGAAKKAKKLEEQQNKGIIIMKNKDIRNIVSEVINENSGQGYAKYPYHTNEYTDEEPQEDYIEEWKALSVQLIRDESRNTAIDIAKILVKDLELFEDVLDLAGQNQSVGNEILSKLKELREK